jgi:dihydrolipoamide dehydrogenase
MQRLGVNTTVFARSRKVGVLTSPKLQQLAQTEISTELEIKFEVLPTEVKYINDQVEISFIENGQPKTLNVDYLLVATGRSSLLNTLKLENIDTSFTDLKHLPVDPETKQLADYPIFIIGDAHTDTPLQHEAAHEGKVSVKNALNFPTIESCKTLTPLGIVFSNPEMAMVGQNFKQLQSHLSILSSAKYLMLNKDVHWFWVRTMEPLRSMWIKPAENYLVLNYSQSLLNIWLIYWHG